MTSKNHAAALAVFSLSVFNTLAFADHETETIYSLGEESGTSASAVCTAYADYFTNLYSSSRTYTGEVVDVFDDGTLYCETKYTTETSSTEKGLAQTQIGVTTAVKEHVEPETCADLSGNTLTEQFSHYLDGDSPDMSAYSCINGCATDVQANVDTEYVNFGDGWEPSVDHYDITMTYTGSECEAATQLPEQDDSGPRDEDPNCTNDYYTSPVTGAIVCGTPETTTTDDNGTTTTTETAEDGTKTTTTTKPDGETTTTKENPDGSTQTTTTTADGSTTTEYTEGDEKTDEADSCASGMYTLVNGEMTCNDSNDDGDSDNKADGGGSCDSEPTCEGDAISCAILNQAWLARCVAETPVEADLIAELGLTEFNDVQTSLYTTIDLSDSLVDGTFDSTGFIGVGGCPTAPSFSFKGQSITFDLDNACWVAEQIGYIVLVLAGITSIRIVTRTDK